MFCGQHFGLGNQMSNLFERKRPNGNSVRQIKELITDQFGLSENTTIAVAELRCHEPGCPPLETVITVRHQDGSINDWRIEKTINEIKQKDIENLKDQKEADEHGAGERRFPVTVGQLQISILATNLCLLLKII